MENNRWIIVPKDEEDGNSWGVKDASFGKLFVGNELQVFDVPVKLFDNSFIESVCKWQILIINYSKLREGNDKFNLNFFTGFSPRVLIHFGDSDISEFDSLNKVKEKWSSVVNKKLSGRIPTEASEWLVMPISTSGENFPGYNFVKGCKDIISKVGAGKAIQEPDELIAKLNKAWQAAELYFDNELNLKNTLDALYPIFTEMSLSEKPSMSDADFKAALGQAKLSIAKHGSGCKEAVELIDILNNLNKENVDEFRIKFCELSKQYAPWLDVSVGP